MAERHERHDPLKNEGEGSKTAARRYDKKAERYSGDEPEAREAREAVDSDEGEELEEAEREGKKHAAEEDPELYD